MKIRGLSAFLFVMLFMMFGVYSAASAYTLFMETTDSDSNPKSEFFPGDELYLNILVDNGEDVTGATITLIYPTSILNGPATNPDGTPVNPGDIVSIFPFQFTHPDTSETTDTFRANASESGKIYLSGVAIDTADGGGLYGPGAGSKVLFRLRFVVTDGAVPDDWVFTLTQTELFHLASGHGVDNNDNGVYDEGVDEKSPVPVLVKAVDNQDPNWDDLTQAFPVLLGDDANPFTDVEQPINISIDLHIAGTVTYAGKATESPHDGTFAVIAYEAGTGTEVDEDTSAAYSLTVPGQSDYDVKAFIDFPDFGTSGERDDWEPRGDYPSNPVSVADSDVTGIDFSIVDIHSDGDGLPDWWEVKYPSLGLDPTLTDTDDDGDSDYDEDWDNDGYSNGEEYELGSDPTDENDPPPFQIVSIDPEDASVVLGGDVNLNVTYDVSDGDQTLTSLGARIHFDSTKLTYTGFDEATLFEFGKLADPQIQDDTENKDGDSATDKLIVIGYSQPFSKDWPGEDQELPLDLVTLQFTASDDPADLGETPVNVTKTTGHTGYGFIGNNGIVTLTEFDLDIDGNGCADGGTDGILILRYLFEFRGDPLVDQAVDLANCTRCDPADIEEYLAKGVDSLVLDADDNGVADGGTDGILILRHLFEFIGDALIDEAVGIDPPCNRCSADDIKRYLDGITPPKCE